MSHKKNSEPSRGGRRRPRPRRASGARCTGKVPRALCRLAHHRYRCRGRGALATSGHCGEIRHRVGSTSGALQVSAASEHQSGRGREWQGVARSLVQSTRCGTCGTECALPRNSPRSHRADTPRNSQHSGTRAGTAARRSRSARAGLAIASAIALAMALAMAPAIGHMPQSAHNRHEHTPRPLPR